ncbi:hypothetical protein MTO96_032446 [Rhipicephalus appendiculatus]
MVLKEDGAVLRVRQKGAQQPRQIRRGDIPSTSQYTPTSIGVSGAEVVIDSLLPKDDGTQTLTDSRKGEDRSDKKSPGGGSSVSSRARSPRSPPTPPHPLDSKSLKSANKGSTAAKTKNKTQTPSSLTGKTPGIGLSGAEVETGLPLPKDLGARTLTDSRKGDDRSNKKSPSGGSSVSNKVPSARSQPTPPRSVGGKSVKSATKASPTVKTQKDQAHTQSSSKKQQPSIGQSGDVYVFDSRSTKAAGARTLTDSAKRDNRTDKKSPSGGSPASRTTPSARSPTTPLHPPGGEPLKGKKKESSAKSERETAEAPPPEQKQQKAEPIPPAWELSKIPAAHSQQKNAHDPEDPGKQSSTKAAGKQKESSAKSERKTSEAPSSQQKQQKAEPIPASEFSKKPAANSQQKNAHDPEESQKQSSTKPAGKGKESSAKSERKTSEAPSSQQKQEKAEPIPPAWEFWKKSAAQSQQKNAHDPEESRKQSSTKAAGKGKESSVKSERKTSEAPSSQQKQEKAEPIPPAWEFWKKSAAQSQQKNAHDPDESRKQSSTKAASKEKESSAKSGRKTSEAPSSQQKQEEAQPFYAGWEFWKRPAAHKNEHDPEKSRKRSSAKTAGPKNAKLAAHAIGCIGLESSSLFSSSSYKEGLEKFVSHLSSELYSTIPGESTDSSGTGKKPKKDTSHQGSPASGTSRVASKYSTKSPKTSEKADAEDIAKDELDLEELISSEIEEEGNIWKKVTGDQCRQTIIAVLVVAVLLVAIYYRRLVGSPKPTAAQALMANFPDAMYHFCRSPSCKTAASEMKASVNITVVPCQDLYSFACGKWSEITNITEISGVPVRLSYMQGLQEAYLDRVEQQLLSPTQDPKASRIGSVYQSCVAFYTNRSADLTEMWPAALIRPDAWLTARDHVALIDLLVNSILTNHLLSIFSIVYHANATVDIKIGKGISDKSLFTLRQYIMTAAINLPANDWFRARETDIKTFNDAVNDLCNQYKDIQNPLLSIRASQFKRNPVAALFSGPIARHLANASKPAVKVIRYPEDASVLQMAQLIGKFDIKLAAVYLLHVPFADYVNFEKESSVLRGNYGHSKTRSVCSDFVHGLFNEAFHSVISTSTERLEFLADINAIWKRIQEAGAGRPNAGGVRLKEDPIPPNVTLALHGTIRDSHRMPHGALDGDYKEDFIVNLILYTLHTGVMVDLKMENSWSSDIVDPKLLQPPYYFKDATEPYINYATLGVTIAQALFQESVSDSLKDSAQLAACFATYGLSHMRVVFDGRDWPYYEGLTWSVEVALDAALGAGRRSAELERFMMVRFARTFCGEDPGARQPLTYVVKSSKTFARAFGCAMPPYPYC